MTPEAGAEALNGQGWVLAFAVGTVFLLVQAWIVAGVSRRVLGVPVGWPRAIPVGLLLAGAATLAAIVLFTTDTGPFLAENVRTHAFFGYILLFMGFILALRAVVLVFQRDRDDADAARPSGR